MGRCFYLGKMADTPVTLNARHLPLRPEID